MALGGGIWLVQNKILPGTYMNFIALHRANIVFSDRGIATMPLLIDWGVQGEVMEVTTSDFQRNSRRIFGYDYTHPALRGLRDLFRHIRVAYLYRLGTGGTKAKNDYATAIYAGERGNAITISISPNVDEPVTWDVFTYFDNSLVDVQTVSDIGGLRANDFVVWNAGATLEAEAGIALEGGVNPTITNADYQTYLDKIESFNFNAIGCPTNDSGVKALFTAFTRRMRDEQGVKFQCVLYNPTKNSDYEGVVDILNAVTDDDGEEQDLVWWTTGVNAGTAVNKSATNSVYNGEYTIDCNYTQLEFERAIKGGKFAFYRSDDEIRVLSDTNSLVNLPVEKSADFQYNQTIRVLDQIGNDIALLFNEFYLGEVPNDAEGRIALWSDIVRHHEQMQKIRAIQEFMPDDVVVEQGETRRAVLVTDTVMPVNAMSFLYMTVAVA